MAILLALSFGVLAVFALGLVLAGRRSTATAGLEGHALPASPPRVSICVPARNEEHNLEGCLTSLREQDYPSFEIVVADDRSTDRTAEILARHAALDPRVVAVRGEEPPEGWYGKPNALRQAVAAANGEWLLMTDADTLHAPSSLSTAIAYALDENVAALSLLPKILTEGFWPQLLVPQLGALLMVGRSMDRINDPSSSAIFGSGAYFLVRKDAYLAAGGIAVVKDALDEDVAFARALKATGLGYRFASGERLCAVKFYTRLGEFFRGFSRNVFSTLGGSVLKVLKLTLVIWTISLVPILTLAASAWSLSHSSELPRWLLFAGIAQYGGVLGIQMIIRRRSGFSPLFALLAPLGGVLVWLIIANSALRGLTRQTVSWKGRTYQSGR